MECSVKSNGAIYLEASHYVSFFFFFLQIMSLNTNKMHIYNEIKLKQSRYRPGVAQRIPES